MKSKINTRVYILAGIVAVLILFLTWVFLPSPRFDSGYWQETNRFYMVYDMSKSMDDSNELSRLQMFRISRKRTRMARKLEDDGQLIGLSRKEVSELLGKDSPWITTNEYAKTLQYVIDSQKRMFQFYGESGIVYARFIVWFDQDERVINTSIE